MAKIIPAQSTKMDKKKLFVSYSGLVRQLYDGRIKLDDLTHSLFYFGCMREHPRRPIQETEIAEIYKEDMGQGQKIYEGLLAVIQKAEKEHRIGYKTEAGNSYRELNTLLTRHKIDVTTVKTLEGQTTYSRSMVAQKYQHLVDIVY